MKYFKSGGGYIEDGNFNPIKFTKAQAVKIAKERLNRNKPFGCSHYKLIEKDDYFCVSIW